MKVRIDSDEIHRARDHVNELLASAIPQGAKKTLCCLIEGLLMQADMYAGFNNNFWRDGGYEDWCAAGKPDFPEKNLFVIGSMGVINKSDDSWVGTNDGEWSRTYCKREPKYPVTPCSEN
jgi:hypothetical protein